MLLDDTTDALATDAPASAPEAPTTETAGLSAGDTPTTDAAGQPRDPHGRFAPRDSESAAPASDATPGADPAATGAAGTAPPDPDAPDAHPAEQAAPLTATEPPAEPPAAPAPFTFRHRGQEYAVEGLTVAPEHAPRIQQMLARAREAETAWPQVQRHVASLEAQVQTKDHAAERLAALMALPDEQFVVEMFALRDELPRLQHQAELERRDARIAALEGRTGQAAGSDVAQQEQMVRHELAQTFVAARERPEFAGLTNDVLDAIGPELEELWPRYLRRATEADALTHGCEIGALFYDPMKAVQTAMLLAQPRIAAKADAERKARAAQAQREAAARNKAVTTASAAPPTPTTGVGGAGTAVPKFKTRDDYDEWLNR